MSSYSTVWQNSGDVLRIFWQIFTFFTKCFEKFWSAGSSHKPILKTSPVPLVYVPISRNNIPFTNIQKKLVSRKKCQSVRLCTDCKIFQFKGTVQPEILGIEKNYRVLACGKISSIYDTVFKFKARMESFKSFENFLQFFNWRLATPGKNPKLRVSRKTQLKSPKVNNQDT